MRWGILDDDGGYFHCIIYSIICLAPQNQTDHLDFLALLLQKLNDTEWCKTLFTRNSQQELESFIWATVDENADQ